MKHFEDEYNQYMHCETPDFWDRIEKALPEKSPEQAVQEKILEFPQKDTYRKGVSRRRILTGTAAAAAGICIILTASVTMKIRNDSEKSAADAFRSSEKAKEFEAEMEAAAEESYTAAEESFTAAEELDSAAEESGYAAEGALYAEEAPELDEEESYYAEKMDGPAAGETNFALEESASESVYISDDALMFAPSEYSIDAAINRFPYTVSADGSAEQAAIITETAVCPWNPDHTLILALITGGEAVSDITLKADLAGGSSGGIRCLNLEDPEGTVYQTVLYPGETKAVLFEQEMAAAEPASLSFSASDHETGEAEESSGDAAGVQTNLQQESRPVQEAGDNMIQASAACELALLQKNEAEPGMSGDNVMSLLENLSKGNEARETLVEMAGSFME